MGLCSSGEVLLLLQREQTSKTDAKPQKPKNK